LDLVSKGTGKVRANGVEIADVDDLSLKQDVLTGLTASVAELNFTDGVTSDIQTQLDSKQGDLTLTTTGTSGAATLIGDTLNIPQYSGGGGGGTGDVV
jgi:hypothetical protein